METLTVFVNRAAADRLTKALRSRVEFFVVGVACAQCGRPWDKPPCGPTHASVAAEINNGETIVWQGTPAEVVPQ